jgi:serine/threonine protein kinase
MASADRRILQDRYQLISTLGAGGMGSVWLAQDLMLERKVAIKELLQHNYSPGQAERRTRALTEARAMARVKHPAIVRIHDVFLDEDDPWIVMEYIRGRPLADIIKDHELDEKATATIGLPVLSGLRAAHRVAVVHRDVKPANILVADDNSVFLVDFGIAKIAGDVALTGQSKVLGTTDFIAPERLLDQRVTPASDLWSLGVTFFYALEGYSPFARKGPEATIAAILRDDPPPLRREGRLADIVLHLLHKDPAQRPSAARLSGILKSILDEPVRQGSQRTPKFHQATSTLPAKQLHSRNAQPTTARRSRIDNGQSAPTDARADHGAADMLRMSKEHAAQQLAGYPPRLAAEILQVIAHTEPETAGRILQMISSKSVGRIVDHLTAQASGSIVAAMPVNAAVRILNCADARAAGGVIMELPKDISVCMIKEMEKSRAAMVLSYVEPVTVAALLGTLFDSDRRLLAELSPTFRAQVMRHIQGRR